MIATSRFIAVLIAALCGASPEAQEGEILYYEETRRGKGNLVVLDLASDGKQQVGQSGSRSDHFPSWSTDGLRIVFESYRKGTFGSLTRTGTLRKWSTLGTATGERPSSTARATHPMATVPGSV